MINLNEYTLDESAYRNRLLCLHLFAMRLFGCVIFSNQRVRILHNFRGLFLSISFAAFNISQYIDLVQIWGQVEEMTTNASTTLLFTTTVFRLFNFYRKRIDWTNLLREVNDGTLLMWKTGSRVEKQILDRHVRYSIILTLGFWVCALFTANLMNFTSFIRSFFYEPSFMIDENTGRNETSIPPLILRSWFPVEDYWQHFYKLYFIQFYIMWVGMIIVPCWHSLMVALMLYAIIKLEQLNYKLKNPKEYLKQDQLGEIMMLEDAKYQILVECICENNSIVKYVRNLERLIWSSVLIDFLSFSVLLCALLFQASQTSIGVQIAIIVCYIATMTSILWIYYWHANEISLWSDRLSLSLYESGWYENSLKYRKSTAIMMSCTIMPISMKAGILDMNLPNFIGILRASYSYFTLLSQMKF